MVPRMHFKVALALAGALALGTPLHAQDCSGASWTPIDSLNTARSRTGVAYDAVTGHFFAAGGEASGGIRNIPIEEYDPVGDTWTDRANLLVGVSNTGAAAVGGYIFVPGGWTGATGVNDMQRFDPAGNSVTSMATLPAANSAHAVVARGNFIHVLGGTSTGGAGTTHYIYDTTANSWSTAAPLPVATNYPAAASDGTLVYVIGGGTTGSDLTNVQIYDPGINSWSAGTPMNVARGGPGAFFAGSQLWAVGGGWTGYLTSTEYFEAGSWTAGPTLNTGARTIGVGFGNSMAVKAGGWAGAYIAAAESLICTSPEANLALTKAANVIGPVAPGATFDYTLTVTNNGPDAATGVVVTDTLPVEVSYVSDDCGGADLPPWTWNIGNLAASASVVCTITVLVGDVAPGDVVNSATVASDLTDPQPGDNTGSAIVTVGQAIPDWVEIPTLSTAGLLALLVLIAGAGLTLLRR
ncbi:MAG: DUF11 domain-containing protein [Acidobacteria bacterium]|nr:DUF11 domain-containing protein [Acidobacteriota bacterium]